MKAVIICLTSLYCFLLFCPCGVCAQEESTIVQVQGRKYIALKLKALDTYNDRLQRQQQSLIKKLKRKEKRFADKLQRTDSAAYVRYRQQSISFDSISRIQADSATLAARVPKRKLAIIDSLKGVETFVQSKGPPGDDPGLQQITQQQAQLNYHNYINNLITQRTSYLKSLSTTPNSNIPGISGIEQEVYYGKAKMQVFKDMEEDPSKAEGKALEYLQGTEGFNKTMNISMAGSNNMQGMSANTTVADLEKMGFQTQNTVQAGLQQKFGSNLSGVAKQLNSQVSQWKGKVQDITSTVNDVSQTKKSLQQLKHTSKPSFKINPMRGLPFWRRIDRNYNYQTTRPAVTGQPAMLNGSVMAGYRQNPKFTYGLGIAASLGMGQNWNNIRFSFQGVGLRSYLSWTWQYGIGLYGGYERMYKRAVFTNPTGTNTDITPTVHNTSTYTESLLAGLTKTYRMNDKWNGQFQVLYDLWYQQEGLRSPIVLRFSTIKK